MAYPNVALKIKIKGMRTSINKQLVALIFAILFQVFAVSSLMAQNYTLSNSASQLTVFGTSNLHDWEVVAEQQSGDIKLVNDGALSISELKVKIVSESLKSGKSGMDKNTYKALKTNSYKSIDFEMLQVKSMESVGNSNYKVTVTGNLTIAGVTKKIELSFKMGVSDSKVTLEGEKAINMTHYNVEPPTALLGTIKTGEELTIKFKSILTK